MPLCQEHGVPLDEALRYLRDFLPPHAVLVGQNIGKDVEWLGLKEGVDFHSLMDLVSPFRSMVPWLLQLVHFHVHL